MLLKGYLRDIFSLIYYNFKLKFYRHRLYLYALIFLALRVILA